MMFEAFEFKKRWNFETKKLWNQETNTPKIRTTWTTNEKQQTTDIPNITQNYFKLTDTGTTTYARKLQSMLRTGPDIVGLADCDDAETAQTLVNFIAPDPRTIYATMHAYFDCGWFVG